MKPLVLWHGGVGGLWRGGIIKPDMAEHRYVEGCPHCEAQRTGTWAPGEDPGTPSGFVYATSDREYARYYASRAVRGTLYRVELADAELSNEDKFPSWRGSSARVLEVRERNITLTWAQRRRLFLRWGGTDAEFDAMVTQVLAAGGAR